MRKRSEVTARVMSASIATTQTTVMMIESGSTPANMPGRASVELSSAPGGVGRWMGEEVFVSLWLPASAQIGPYSTNWSR